MCTHYTMNSTDEARKLLIIDRQQIRKALGKSENDVREYIDIIKKWFETQKHLPEVPTDELIEHFLVINKFSVETTKEKLDLYYSIRTLVPECFKLKNPKLPHMKQTAKIIYYCPLPKLTNELYRVNVTKITGDPSLFNTYNFFAHQLNINEIRLKEDLNLGDILIADLRDVRGGHVVKFTPVQMKKAAVILEKVFSNRIKGIHIINAPHVVDTAIGIVKSVLNPKIVERLHVHSSPDNLLNFISSEILPKDYGGNEKSLEELHDLWSKKLEEHQERFDKLDSMKVREELRPKPLKNDEILGYHGNFRKLEVD